MSTATAAPTSQGSLTAGLRLLFSAYRVELALFLVSYAVLAMFSGQRFLRQSEAPHFVYQAKAWLEGHLDIEAEVLPNLEDWACVRLVGGAPTRCTAPLQAGDKWYSSFPSFPSAVMLPFVAINGYQLNDTSFGVLVGALCVALFYALLRKLSQTEGLDRDGFENAALSLLLAFGTLFFYCSIRGEVWFSAEVMGVAFTCLYARNGLKADRPLLAGLCWSMAVTTRTPLFFTGVFFVLEALTPTQGKRLAELKAFLAAPKPGLRKLGLFAAGAAPLGLLHAAYNQVRFGSVADFGHRFFFNNRVNADIDTYGLFHPHYLGRNLDAAFLKLPRLSFSPLNLSYDAWGMSLLLTLPVLVLVLFPKARARLQWPLWLTVAACAVPGFFYQNTGYAQFGFRFSLDYTPYILLLVAVSGWSFKQRQVQAVAALSLLVNFWGAVGFSGYTELIRRW